jgi:hypothetical protein
MNTARPSSPTSTGLRRAAAAALVGGAVAANLAFVGLGSSFNYPDVLQEESLAILRRFDGTRGSTMAWFAVLALGAALLAPGAILVGRLGRGRAAIWSIRVGVAAAVVQVIGLSRWFLLVPGFADRAGDASASAASRSDAVHDFERAHDVLGKLVGETLGYTFTAAWTALAITALAGLPRWCRWLGFVSAGLILCGVLVPLDVPGTDLANFVGYVLWSIWLLVMAWLIVRRSVGGLGNAAGRRVHRTPVVAG